MYKIRLAKKIHFVSLWWFCVYVCVRARVCVFYLTTLSAVKVIYQGWSQRGSRLDTDPCIQVVCMHKMADHEGLYSKEMSLTKQL